MNEELLEPERREEKLPAWVQNRLDLLRMRLREAIKTIDERTNSAPDSDTIVDPYGDYPHGLARGETIEFQLENGHESYIRARVLRAHGRVTLDLNAGSSIHVAPRASNAIEIEIRER